MNKRIAKKVLKYRGRLNYTESQVIAAIRKLGLMIKLQQQVIFMGYKKCPESTSREMTEECKSGCVECTLCGAPKGEYSEDCIDCMECLERNEVKIE